MALNPIPQPICALIELFSSTLRDVKFPGVDEKVLSALSDEVHHASADLEKAQAAVEAARLALDEKQKDLRKKAQHGLSYARVFADGDLELQKELAEISLVSSPKAPRKTTRKRKKNAEPAQDLLSAVGADASETITANAFDDVESDLSAEGEAHEVLDVSQEDESLADAEREPAVKRPVQKKAKKNKKGSRKEELERGALDEQVHDEHEPFLVQAIALDDEAVVECVDPPGADAGAEAA
ncbi:MAG: hypothetical protein GY822_25665 [Deltaproteobacteria bacterium]|nr:hypothetical protein [Deltaproteobacteria bacterium]